jgi:excisionase family DNA binding protein
MMLVAKRDEHQVAYAVVELEDARSELRAAVPAGGRRPRRTTAAGSNSESVAAALELLEGALERLEHGAAAARGLPVSQAAQYLGVSEPTVRSWLKRGVLRKVPRSKPLLIERSSLRRVHAALGELRARGQERDWLQALVDLLHDRAERRRPEIQRGLEELRRGRLEPA